MYWTKELLTQISDLYKSERTMEEIGELFSVSKQRIYQLLKRAGINGSAGGAFIRHRRRIESYTAGVNARCLARWGVTSIERKKIIQQYGYLPFLRYKAHRGNAAYRGIKFRLTFKQWWSIWTASKQWEARGRNRLNYVMTRKLDKGDYAIGNVEIKTASENHKEYNSRTRKERQANRK